MHMDSRVSPLERSQMFVGRPSHNHLLQELLFPEQFFQQLHQQNWAPFSLGEVRVSKLAPQWTYQQERQCMDKGQINDNYNKLSKYLKFIKST